MNKFLSSLEITFRRDSENLRPRINKLNSVKVNNERFQPIFNILLSCYATGYGTEKKRKVFLFGEVIY